MLLLPASVAKKLIAMLSPEERAATNILMGYKPETAGRIMTTEYVSLKKDITVEQSIEKVPYLFPKIVKAGFLNSRH